MNDIQYEPFLVGLSYVISVFGSYTALQLAIASAGADLAAVIGSVTGASVALGGGAIWSMHFIGMNAADYGGAGGLRFRCLTFLSLILAVVAPAIGLGSSWTQRRRHSTCLWAES